MGKRILILGTAYPYRGGLSAFNERIAKAFQENGDEVEIETFTVQYPSFLFPGKTQYSNEPAPENIKIERSINSVNPISWIKTGLKLKKRNYDFVIVKFWIPFMAPALGTICKIIKSNKHTQIISVLDNIIPHEHRIGDKLLSGYFVKNVDGFVAMSKSVLEDLNLFDKNKPRVFSPHPVYDNFGSIVDKETALEKLGLDKTKKHILFFGFIRDYKGLDLLIDALKIVKEDLPDIRLVIAGEYYSNREKYENQIKETNLADFIIQKTDFIPDSEVATYFCASDFVVQPYKTATQSGVTQIAYNFHKPMIVTNVGGLAEIVPDGNVGYVVDVNPDAIASAILKLYKENKVQEFTENVILEKQKYSWEYMLKNIYSLLK
ncbi:MAG: glycosyltransferase [Bacteroidota bacterium]